MLLKPYPDRALPALARVVSDVLTLAWMVAWALAGLAVYQTVMALEAIADGITSTGRTFNSWIEAIRSITPRGVPYLSNFLLDEANALQRASGDQLVALGNQVHGDIFQAAVILGLMVAVPPIVIVGTASNTPKNSAPASPIMMRAGFQLNGKNPRHTPTAMIATSGPMLGSESALLSVSFCANKNSAPPLIATTPAASPSRPSMKLTALMVATTTRMVSTIA